MTDKLFIGRKIRRLRQAAGMTQTKAAESLGISSSYLNLIEHNHRPLTLPLLLKLAHVFDVDLNEFSDGDEGQLADDLLEVFSDEIFRDLGIDAVDIRETAETYPELAVGVRSLFLDRKASRDRLAVLGERLAEYSSQQKTVFDLRTRLTTVRSFSEILLDNVNLSEDERRRFVSILADEGRLLTERIEAFLDTTTPGRADELSESPDAGPDIDAVFEQNANYLDELEQAAGRLRAELDRLSPDPGNALRQFHTVRYGSSENRAVPVPQAPPADLFSVAVAIAEIECAVDFETYFGSGFGKRTDPEAMEARKRLAEYVAAAMLMPYDAFLADATAFAYDVDLLAERYRVSFDQACFRLATLRRGDALGIPFHLVEVDIAGNILKRMSGSGLRIPQTGNACPRWSVHAAFTAPGQTRVQLAETLDGGRYLCVAKAFPVAVGGFLDPVSYRSVSIGCDAVYAGATVYGSGTDLTTAAFVPIGSTCRTCQRDACPQRAFPNFLGGDQ